MPDDAFTELAGQREALRRFQLGDVADFVAYRSAEQVARFQSWDAPFSREAGGAADQRSQASWTASSASATVPSMR